jgi:hypothetical protein
MFLDSDGSDVAVHHMIAPVRCPRTEKQGKDKPDNGKLRPHLTPPANGMAQTNAASVSKAQISEGRLLKREGIVGEQPFSE